MTCPCRKKHFLDLTGKFSDSNLVPFCLLVYLQFVRPSFICFMFVWRSYNHVILFPDLFVTCRQLAKVMQTCLSSCYRAFFIRPWLYRFQHARHYQAFKVFLLSEKGRESYTAQLWSRTKLHSNWRKTDEVIVDRKTAKIEIVIKHKGTKMHKDGED